MTLALLGVNTPICEGKCEENLWLEEIVMLCFSQSEWNGAARLRFRMFVVVGGVPA